MSQAAGHGGLTAMPDDIRKLIFQEVMNIPHLLHIFQDPEGPVESFAPWKPKGWLSPLTANRTIGVDAAAALYSSHAFNFLETDTPKQLALLRQFLAQIGPKNAQSLCHICINFPFLKEEGLPDDSVQEMDVLVSDCPNLQVLELYIHAQEYDLLVKRCRDGSDNIQKDIAGLNDRVRKLAWLNRVIVRFYTGTPTPGMERVLADVGWEVLPKYAVA